MSGYPAAMSETTHQFGHADARVRDISTAQLLGQVMFLVAVALGFCALGTVLGRDLELGTARICSFAGLGMLLVSSFAGARFRVGAFAMGWLFATALLIGLGLGPVIAYYASVEPNALTQAFAVHVEQNSGVLDHTLATALIGPVGKLQTIWRGNRWTVDEVLAALAR